MFCIIMSPKAKKFSEGHSTPLFTAMNDEILLIFMFSDQMVYQSFFPLAEKWAHPTILLSYFLQLTLVTHAHAVLS